MNNFIEIKIKIDYEKIKGTKFDNSKTKDNAFIINLLKKNWLITEFKLIKFKFLWTKN